MESDPLPDGTIKIRPAFGNTSFIDMLNPELRLGERDADARALLARQRPDDMPMEKPVQRSGWGFSYQPPAPPRPSPKAHCIVQMLGNRTLRVNCLRLAASADMADVMATGVLAAPPKAETVLTNAEDVNGKVCVIYMSADVPPTTQLVRAHRAGALACVLVSPEVIPVDYDPSGSQTSASIPVLMVGKYGGRQLVSMPEAMLTVRKTDTLPAIVRDVYTEEDVLFEPTLPDFDGALNQHESEQLLCLLTAPYLAPVLVLEFFSHDRVACLVDHRLQVLLESVLFDPGPVACGEEMHAQITHIPVPEAERNFLYTKHGM